MTPLAMERWWPLLAAVAALAAWVAGDAPSPATDSHRDVFATTMSLAAITVGFLATAMSIVVSAPDGPLQTRLAESGYLKDLIRYLEEPFMVGIAVAVVCMVGFVLPQKAVCSVYFWATWASLSAWMVAGLLRIGRIFVKLLVRQGHMRVEEQRRREAAAQATQPQPWD